MCTSEHVRAEMLLRHMRRLRSCDRAAHAVYGQHRTVVHSSDAATPVGAAVEDRRLHHPEMAMAEIDVHPSGSARAAFTDDAALQKLSVSAIVHDHSTTPSDRTAALDPAATLQRDVGVAVDINSTTSRIIAESLAVRDRTPHQHGTCARPHGERACARKTRGVWGGAPLVWPFTWDLCDGGPSM